MEEDGLMKDEACPKCRSRNVGVWSFNSAIVDYECKRCRHRWVSPREAVVVPVYSCQKVPSYIERGKKKLLASCLEEFCTKFKECKDSSVLIWPYIPRHAVEGESDFGLIVESGHVKYEKGLSWVLFHDDDRLLPGWIQPQRSAVFDFDSTRHKIAMFQEFARGLSRHLTEKGCKAVAREIQHLDRTPEETVGDEDLRTIINITTTYC